jgi:hypothetical protein
MNEQYKNLIEKIKEVLPKWIRKQIIDLITLRNDKETLKEIMKDLPDIMRGKDFPTKHGILSIGKLISKKK